MREEHAIRSSSDTQSGDGKLDAAEVRIMEGRKYNTTCLHW
jgi:hypothetical protein